MSQRFFCSTAIVGQQATLIEGEARHLARVMRAKIGDEVILFDGSGAEFSATVRRIAKSSVDLTVLDRRKVDRELPFDLTLAVALPKGDRQRWLVEKAVELGVTRLVPLATTRGVADGTAALDRLRRGVIEACKQCGRNRLMQIAAARQWKELAGDTEHAAATRLFAHPQGNAVADAETTAPPAAHPVVIAIGPEGGWTDDEVALAQRHNWRFVDLGPRILRVETAAIALASTAIAQRTGVKA